MLLKIAWRNLFRHRRRTLFSAITIGVGLMFFIVQNSMMRGVDRGSIDNMIELSTAAVKIHSRTYEQEQRSYPLQYPVPDREGLKAFLLRQPRVKALADRTVFLGRLSNYTEEIPVVGTVVAPATDTTVFSLVRYLEGGYFSGHNGQEIILGYELARELGVKVGDDITLAALTRYDSRNADEFRIVGLLRTTDPNLNKSSVLITYEAANRFLDLENLVTEVNVRLERRVNFDDLVRDMQELQAAIQQNYPDLTASTFRELGAAILEAVRQKSRFGVVFMLVILLIAAVGIFNTVLMSMYERVREVGVLRAHGLTPGEITRLFVWEGLLTGLLGSLLGVILGVGLNLPLTVYGYSIEKIMGSGLDTSNIPYWGTMYGEWNPPAILFVFFFGILVALAASIIPARMAGRLTVTDALKFN
jgi:putative ABC transport system permease protein